MKRGSEDGDTEKEAKKPKEDAKAPAPAPAPVKEDEPPVCNVGNLLEICDQDVDFAVELVGEGGQEMTGHAAKAVQQATKTVANGPIMQGLRLPVNDLSRGATVEDIVQTCAATALQAQDAKRKEMEKRRKTRRERKKRGKRRRRRRLLLICLISLK